MFSAPTPIMTCTNQASHATTYKALNTTMMTLLFVLRFRYDYISSALQKPQTFHQFPELSTELRERMYISTLSMAQLRLQILHDHRLARITTRTAIETPTSIDSPVSSQKPSRNQSDSPRIRRYTHLSFRHSDISLPGP